MPNDREDVPAVKQCRGCGDIKSLSDFSKKKDGKFGRAPRCKECERRRRRDWWSSLPEEERQRRSRENHIRYESKKTPEQIRKVNLRKKYGISIEEYDAMLAAQGGVCAICQKGCRRALSVDHDHRTGEVRGLLCANCNIGIGYFYDNQEFLNRAARYLA